MVAKSSPPRRTSLRPHKVLARVGATLFWCDRCNVPLLTRVCGLCRGEGRPLKLTPPADARPSLGRDYVQLWRLIESELGVQPFPRRRIVLLNKIPYPDSADEVVIDGYIVGHRYFDLREARWRFRPLYVGASELVRRRVGHYAIVDLPHLARAYEVHRDRVVEGEVPREKGLFVALATPTGHEGLGVTVGRGRVRVLKVWRAKTYAWKPANPTWLDAAKANEARLSFLEQEAVSYLRELAAQSGLRPVVSFSGGKDSLVAYALARKAFGRTPLLFNDTGLELPGTVAYVKRFAEREGAELTVAGAGEAFWRSLRVMGPPARDYRWCCKVCKLVPTARAFRERFSSGALSIVGQRRLESAARALSPRTHRNRWIPNVLVASPIHNWTALDVWLYIFRERLPVNELYFRGFDRLGCWLCPAIELGEAQALRELDETLWEAWEDFLRGYAAERGLCEEWVRLGLWRWLEPPGDIKRLAQRGCSEPGRGPRVEVSSADGGRLLITVGQTDRGYDEFLRNLAQLAKTLGASEAGGGRIRLGDLELEVARRTNGFEVALSGAAGARLREVVSVVIRAAYCLGCGSCEVWCSERAIRAEGGMLEVDGSKCRRCGICNSVCPLVEYAVRGRRELLEAVGSS